MRALRRDGGREARRGLPRGVGLPVDAGRRAARVRAVRAVDHRRGRVSAVWGCAVSANATRNKPCVTTGALHVQRCLVCGEMRHGVVMIETKAGGEIESLCVECFRKPFAALASGGAL